MAVSFLARLILDWVKSVLYIFSENTDTENWTVNSICLNKKADVNFENGINLGRNFGPPLRYINILPKYCFMSYDRFEIILNSLMFKIKKQTTHKKLNFINE